MLLIAFGHLYPTYKCESTRQNRSDKVYGSRGPGDTGVLDELCRHDTFESFWRRSPSRSSASLEGIELSAMEIVQTED